MRAMASLYVDKCRSHSDRMFFFFFILNNYIKFNFDAMRYLLDFDLGKKEERG